MKKIRKQGTIIVKVAGFLTGLVLIFVLSGYLFLPEGDMKIYDKTAVSQKNEELREQTNDTIDVLFLGDSECYSSFNPLQMFAEQGYTSFVCGTSAQRLCDTYAILQEAFLTQTPDVVVLETNCLFRALKTESDTKDYAMDKLSERLPIFENHTRWKEMFTKSATKKIDKDEKNRGFLVRTTVKPYNGGEYMLQNSNRRKIAEDVEQYLNLIAECCKNKQAELLLVSVPSPRNWNYEKHNAVSDWADAHDVVYQDLNLEPEIGIDWSDDTKDGGDHLNFSGAKKVSRYIGAYLADTYRLPDHRENPDYQHWKDDCMEYVMKDDKTVR